MHSIAKLPAALVAALAVALATFAAAPAARAQAAGAAKIGVVDYNRLLAEAPQARAAAQTLETEFGPRQKQLEQTRKDLEGRLQKFERDQATMAEAERTKTQRELRDAQLNFERRAKEFQEDGQMRQNEELQRVQRLIIQEVQNYARAQGYDLVIAQGVIYRSDAIDITQAILGTLEKRGAAAPAPAPAPAPAQKPAGR
ncbi:MAG: OmpH family outer membrane protein [Steroidobacteraceae bacterium]|jgi:outer membrane protein|nr:OmpH family outer membrane protein [Steroidobacteraceae bacterium]